MRTIPLVSLACAVLAGCSGSDRASGLSGNVVAVSSIGEPVAVSGVSQPVAISRVAQPVAVSAIESPVTISSSSPLAVLRPELDPERIENGTELSGTPFDCIWTVDCREVASGPFVLTDVVASSSTTVRFSAGPSFSAPRWQFLAGANATITGARFAVRAGEKLYLEPIAGTVVWSGFRP